MNNNVHMLWYEGKLDTVSQLSIKSVLNFGHELNIWSYDKDNLIKLHPEFSMIIGDASLVLPLNVLPNHVLKHPYLGRDYSIILSDFFRYQVIYQFGGWYLDTDIILLQRLKWLHEFGYRQINGLPSTNVFYCEKPEQEYIRFCYNHLTIKWNSSMYRMVKKFGFTHLSFPPLWFGIDQCKNYFMDGSYTVPKLGIHLCRSWASKKGYLDRLTGLYGKLRRKYQV